MTECYTLTSEEIADMYFSVATLCETSYSSNSSSAAGSGQHAIGCRNQSVVPLCRYEMPPQIDDQMPARIDAHGKERFRFAESSRLIRRYRPKCMYALGLYLLTRRELSSRENFFLPCSRTINNEPAVTGLPGLR